MQTHLKNFFLQLRQEQIFSHKQSNNSCFFIRAQVRYLQDESALIALQPVRFSINIFSIPANVATKRELCRIQTRRTGCQIFTKITNVESIFYTKYGPISTIETTTNLLIYNPSMLKIVPNRRGNPTFKLYRTTWTQNA